MTLDEAMHVALQHHQAGRLDEAEMLCRQVLALRPNRDDALNLLGVMACRAGYHDMAMDLIGRAIQINPSIAEYHSNLGNLQRAAGRTQEAIAAYRAALKIKPDLAEVYSNLGCALAGEGQLDEAVAAHRMAVGLNTNLAEVHSNLANALVDQCRIDQAIAAYRAAVALNPEHAEVQCNLAMCLLLQGDFAGGWAGYEWRLRCSDSEFPMSRFSQPCWQGEELGGKTILLHSEQGLGDAIQFIRYASLVARRDGRVIVQCQRELIQLFKQLPDVTQWVATDEALPAFDVHCPLLSLPSVFGTILERIPAQSPPLRAAADRAEFWRIRLANHSGNLKVGLAWAGNPSHRNDRNRSMSSSLLAPLAQVPGVRLFSLQKGPAGQFGTVSRDLPLVDYTGELHDFSETAALIDSLDLVISVDTVVAHLSGAMGKPVWLLLPFAPDWRWMLDRSDSPWYPSMRLFRQHRPGDWPDVVQRVAAEVAHLATQAWPDSRGHLVIGKYDQ